MRTGRPPTPVGTYGKIRTYKTGPSWRATTIFRDFNGRSVRIERYGPTTAAAERRLKEAIRDRTETAGGTEEITAHSYVKDLAEHWWTEFLTLGKSPGTYRLYRDRLDNQIIPGLGDLRVRELTTAAINRHVKAVGESNGAAIAKAVRTIFSNICAHACRLDAMEINPCREVATVKGKTKKAPRALSLDEVREIRVKFAADEAAVRQELPDLVDAMLATGLRIAETLAIQWPDLDLEAGTLKTGNIVVRIKGQGLTIKSDPTSKVKERVLALPAWGVALFKRRSENRRASKCEWDPVFMSSVGTLKDPDNAHTQFREAAARNGFDDLVPHHFRKTTATTLDKAGLTAREIADQLGHSKVSMAQDNYMGRIVVNPNASKALEGLAPDLV